MSFFTRPFLAVAVLAGAATLPGACTFPEYQFADGDGSGGAIGGTAGGGSAGSGPLGGSGGGGGSAGIGETGGSGGEAPDPTCTDGIANGDETGVDCGGPECVACANDSGCKTNDDCVSQRCDGVDQVCRPGLAVQCRCTASSTCTWGSVPVSEIAFRIENRSTIPLDLDGVVLRYYFSLDKDGDQAVCTDSGLPGGCDGMQRVEQRPNSPETQRATHVLELAFSEANGSVSPGTSTATTGIEIRAGQDQTEPLNDYSFEEGTTMRDCPRITLHRENGEAGGALIWGTQPPADD